MLRREVDELKEFVGKLAQAQSFENIVASGFDGIKEQLEAQLAPLRALDTQHTTLSDLAWGHLRSIRLSLARPTFTQEEPGETAASSVQTSRTNSTSKEQAS